MKKETLCKIFCNMPAIKTARLTLRPMHITDACDMFEYASKPESSKFLTWSPHASAAYTRNYLKYLESRYALGDFYDWAVTLTESGKMIGTCGFTKIDITNGCAEIGYVINPEFHGRGYATEAAEAIIKFGFESLGLNRLEARFIQENTASLRVMEKLGMSLEGYHRDAMLVKGSYRTVGVCSILRNEYIHNK